MSKISVVIPVYNKQAYIKDTINSVLTQSFADYELIIIDDGSTDNSVSIIQNFDDSRIKFFSQENAGVSAARNRGVALAQSDIIAFLDADDTWYPNHLQEIYSLSQSFPQAGLFATAYRIKHSDKLLKDVVYSFEKNPIELMPFYKNTTVRFLFYTSNFALRKSVIEREGGFKSIHAEDSELFLRLGHKYPLAYSNVLTMLYLQNSENSLSASYSIDEESKILDSFTEIEQWDIFLKKYLDAFRYDWAIRYKVSGDFNKYRKMKNDLDFANLNWKQQFLLRSPASLLRLAKYFQTQLKKAGIYITAFE